MPATPNQQIPYPAGTDPARLAPDQVRAAVEAIESLAVARYADASQRAARHANPVDGQISWLQETNRWEGYKNGVWGEINPIGMCAVVSRSTSQTMSGGTGMVKFDTVEADTSGGAMVDLDSNNDRITIVVSGLYLVAGQLPWAADASGTFRAVGVGTNQSNLIYPAAEGDAPTASIQIQHMCFTVISVTAGDTVNLWARTTAGGVVAPNPTVSWRGGAGTCQPRLSVAQIG